MGTSLAILLIIASLVLLTGVLALVAIVLVAKRCRIAQKPSHLDQKEEVDGIDPWKEAGKRMKSPFDEPS